MTTFQRKQVQKLPSCACDIFFRSSALQTPLWHEAHQPLLDNDAAGSIKHSLGSPIATLDSLMGLVVAQEVIALLCDQTQARGD